MRMFFSAIICLACTWPIPAQTQEITPGPRVLHDIVYGHKDGMALTYDVILPPEGVARNGATVVFVISGGWVSTWFPAERLLSRRPGKATLIPDLLEDGYNVVILRHGSSPRYNVIEAVEDVRRAIQHLRSDLPRHGLDPERIGIFGFSAGGHLSLVMGTMGGSDLPNSVRRSRIKEREEGSAPTDLEVRNQAPVAAVVAWFPPTDLRPIVGPSESFPALDVDRKRAAEISPRLHADLGDAPALLMHGTADGLVPINQSRLMYEALQEAGVECEFEIFQGAGHGFKGADEVRAGNLAKAWFDRWLLQEDQEEE